MYFWAEWAVHLQGSSFFSQKLIKSNTQKFKRHICNHLHMCFFYFVGTFPRLFLGWLRRSASPHQPRSVHTGHHQHRHCHCFSDIVTAIISVIVIVRSGWPALGRFLVVRWTCTQASPGAHYDGDDISYEYFAIDDTCLVVFRLAIALALHCYICDDEHCLHRTAAYLQWIETQTGIMVEPWRPAREPS